MNLSHSSWSNGHKLLWAHIKGQLTLNRCTLHSPAQPTHSFFLIPCSSQRTGRAGRPWLPCLGAQASAMMVSQLPQPRRHAQHASTRPRRRLRPRTRGAPSGVASCAHTVCHPALQFWAVADRSSPTPRSGPWCGAAAASVRSLTRRQPLACGSTARRARHLERDWPARPCWLTALGGVATRLDPGTSHSVMQRWPGQIRVQATSYLFMLLYDKLICIKRLKHETKLEFPA